MFFFANSIKPNQPLARRGLAHGLDLMDRVLSQLEVSPGHIERNLNGRWRIVIDPLTDTGALAGITATNGDSNVSNGANDGIYTIRKQTIDVEDTAAGSPSGIAYSLAGIDGQTGGVSQDHSILWYKQDSSGGSVAVVADTTFTDTVTPNDLTSLKYFKRPSGYPNGGGGRLFYVPETLIDLVWDIEVVDTGTVLRLHKRRLYAMVLQDTTGSAPADFTDDVPL